MSTETEGEPMGLADLLDRLDDVARDLWSLVDVPAEHRHDEDDGPRRLELRAVQEHTAQAWAQAQHAVTVLRSLIALDGREMPRG